MDKKTKTTKKVKAKTETDVLAKSVIKKPRITEKATELSNKGMYTFEVEKNATKSSVKQAVLKAYKVDLVKVRIVNLPTKNIIMRGIKGKKSGVKKAVVYLKKGDKIDFV